MNIMGDKKIITNSMKEIGGYWVYKTIDGIVTRRRPSAKEINEAERASVKYITQNK